MSEQVQILPYSSDLKEYFWSLNVEWLEKYFYVEDIDKRVLGNPQEEILDHGGSIIFAEFQNDIVGTCALKHHGDGLFELTKMGVTEKVQGKGIGRALLNGCIEEFKRLNGTRLYLESHKSLGPALKLYETGGFEHAKRPEGPRLYERSDVYMVYTDIF